MSNGNSNPVIIPSTVTSSAPYYDTYNQSQDYYRVLFKPGYPVQARELTTLQTMLQAQMAAFGQNIFVNGSQVVGGQLTFQGGPNTQVGFVNLQSTYNNTQTIAANFGNSAIFSINSNSVSAVTKAFVIATQEQTSSTPPTLIVKYVNTIPLLPNTVIRNWQNTTIGQVATGTPTGNSSTAHIHNGIYFVNGFFAAVPQQTIILDPYDDTPSCVVGLLYSANVINYTEDSSLLDPALGASNYLGPGADRLQITLTLTSLPLNYANNTNFFALMTIENGNVVAQIAAPDYSELLSVMAERTFEQSGNFTVKPFGATLSEMVPQTITGTVNVANNGIIVTGTNTSFTTAVSVGSTVWVNNQSALVNSISSATSMTVANTWPFTLNNQPIIVQNPAKFTVKLSPGEAYLQGYDYQFLAPTFLTLSKGRSYANVSEYSLYTPLGNIINVSNIRGLPNIAAWPQYDLHIAAGDAINYTSSTTYGNTKIGTAKIRAFEYEGGTLTNAISQIFNAYLFDISITNSSYTIAQVNAIAQFSSNTVFTVDPSSQVSGAATGNGTFLTDSQFNVLIYPLPAGAPTVPATITDVNYRYKQVASSVAFTNGAATLTVSSPLNFIGSGVLQDLIAQEAFTVTVTAVGTSSFAVGQLLPMVSGLGRSITVSPITTAAFNANTLTNFTAEVIYSVGMTGSGPSARVKTPTYSNSSIVLTGVGTTISNTTITGTGQVTIANGDIQKTSSNNQLLYTADIFQLVAVYDFQGLAVSNTNLASAANITYRYQLNTGQNDNYYDQGWLKLLPGVAAPIGPLVAFINYYTHSGSSGFLTVDSYPNAGTNSGYANIPDYTSPSTGIVYDLAECIDWRPIVQNAVAEPPPTFLQPLIVEPGFAFELNYSYYLSRIDQITLTNQGTFKVYPGVSATIPVPPQINGSDLLIYTLDIPAYTYAANDVTLIYSPNKRYTMADIGILDKRITNLEYYSALSLLEISTTSQNLLDTVGTGAFQNGIVVDGFIGHGVGDVVSPDYYCSIDFTYGGLHPFFISNNALFNISSGGSSNYSEDNTGMVTLPWTPDVFLSQPYATDSVSANPFNFVQWVGVLEMYPPTNTWYNQTIRPAVVANLDGNNDAWEFLFNGLSQTGYGTQYGDWQTNWTGVSASGTTTVQSQTVTTTSVVPTTVTQSLGDLVTNVSVIPYIEGQAIVFHSMQLQPSAIMYPFFGGISIMGYWQNPTLLQMNWPQPTPQQFYSNSHSEVVVGQSSGAAAVLMAQPWMDSLISNTVVPYLVVVNQVGHFSNGETVIGSISGAEAVISNILQPSDFCSQASSNGQIIFLNSTSAAQAVAAGFSPVGYQINLPQGTGQGQISIITAFNTGTYAATVYPPFAAPGTDTSTLYSIGAPQTSGHGFITGTFLLPNPGGSAPQWECGQQTALLTTSPFNGPGATCYSTGQFYAQGLTETLQPTYVQATVPSLTTTTTVQQQTLFTPAPTPPPPPPPPPPTPPVPPGVPPPPPPPPPPSPPPTPTNPNPPPSPPPCFAAGTLVDTPSGPKLIEKIKEGDFIISFDENMELQMAQVTHKCVHVVEALPTWSNRKLVQVKFWSGKMLEVTLNHPIWLPDKEEWRPVRNLQVGDLLMNKEGNFEMISSISLPMDDRTTYNLEVDMFHTYIANGIRVHNGCGCGGGGSKTPASQAAASGIWPENVAW